MALTTQPHTCPREVGLSDPLPGILPEMAREAEANRVGAQNQPSTLPPPSLPGDGTWPRGTLVALGPEGREDQAQQGWEAPALLTLHLEKVAKADPCPLVGRGQAVTGQRHQQSHQGAELLARTSSLQGRAAGKGLQAAPAPARLYCPSCSLSSDQEEGQAEGLSRNPRSPETQHPAGQGSFPGP